MVHFPAIAEVHHLHHLWCKTKPQHTASGHVESATQVFTFSHLGTGGDPCPTEEFDAMGDLQDPKMEVRSYHMFDHIFGRYSLTWPKT